MHNWALTAFGSDYSNAYRNAIGRLPTTSGTSNEASLAPEVGRKNDKTWNHTADLGAEGGRRIPRPTALRLEKNDPLTRCCKVSRNCFGELVQRSLWLGYIVAFFSRVRQRSTTGFKKL